MSTDCIYKIFDIQDIKTNKSRCDSRYLLRIGRTCKFIHGKLYSPMCLEYLRNADGSDCHNMFLITSPISNITIIDGMIKVTTMNSIYFLKLAND